MKLTLGFLYKRNATKLLLTALINISTFFVHSQNFWENTYSGLVGRSVSETSDGGFIVASEESTNLKVYKLDNSGNVTWKRALGSFSYGSVVKETLDGGYIAVGKGPWGGRDIAVIKLNSSGTKEWGGVYELDNVFEARDVIQLQDSSYIVAASGGDNSGFDASGLVKFDKDGNLLWSKSLETCTQSGCHPEINFLLDNGNGELFAFGEYEHNSSYRTGWIIKFDASGTILENRSVFSRISGATKTSDGNIVVTGIVSGPIADAYMMKFNPQTMSVIWTRQYDVTMPFSNDEHLYGMSVIEGSNSDLYMFATTSSNFTRCMIVRVNLSGSTIGYTGFNSYNYASGTVFKTRMGKTSDNGLIFLYGDRIKKIPEEFSTLNTCELFTGTSIATSSVSASMGNVSPTVTTQNSNIGNVTSSSQTAPTAAQTCSSYYCSPVNGTDVQSACSSLTWIDGVTYTASNNTATYTYVGGAANGCDSIVTLDLTISDVLAPVADAASLADITEQCSVTSLTAPTATDNCAGAVTGTHNATLPITSQGTTVVTWTYDDGNGNTSTQTQNVIIDDVTAPVPNIATLASINAECSVSSLTPPTATDNCAGAITGAHNASLPITNQGTTVVTWTYDDGNGNTSTQTQNVVIDDVTAPIADAVSLSDLSAQCEVTSLTAPTATDNCAGTITGTHNATLPITTQGTTVVTWTYYDENGNTSTQTQNVVIDDVTAPIADAVSLSDLSAQCEVTSLTAPTATDNCAGSITGTHNATLPITTQGTTVVTWTYYDGNGNTSTQTQNVVIDDVTAPVPDLVTLTNITSECSVTSLTPPTATDNCAGAIIGTHNATLPITAQGTTVVTWTYDDVNGNTSTQTQNVIIDDVTAPVADVAILADVTSECEVTSLTAPTATDNCAGAIIGTHNATLPITAQGTTVVTWTYDDGNGNTSTQTQNVITDDVTAPVADAGSLAPVTAECQVTSIPAPTATDNCAGTVTGTPNVTFPITTQGTFTITWTYNDGNGNTSTQTQNVTIDDATAPVPDNAILSTINEACSATPTAPTATDNCAGSITATPDVSFPITTQGTTVVTWTYDDGNGNTATQTQNVIIDDATAPVADAATLADITSECEVTSLTPPTATDNCLGSVTGVHNVTLPITASGTTAVTWTYDDGNGNTSTQTQDVVITPIDNTVTQVNATTLSANASGYSYQWVDCDNGNAPIAGETSQTFVASANGSYAVIIDNGVCSVTSACIVIDEVGIEESDNQSFIKVFPNPTKGMVTITTSQQVSGLRLMNALGQVVYESSDLQSKEISIELPEATGVYFLQVEVNGRRQTHKVIKH